MPSSAIAYVALALVITVVLAQRNFGHADGPRLLVSFLVWIVSIAIIGLVIWTLVACAYLHGDRLSFIPLCLYGSAMWASVIVGIYVPGYAAILAALVRFGTHERRVERWILLSAALALPAGIALFLGYAWPDYTGDTVDVAGGLAPGVMAWASMFGALISTRRLMPSSRRGVSARAV